MDCWRLSTAAKTVKVVDGFELHCEPYRGSRLRENIVVGRLFRCVVTRMVTLALKEIQRQANSTRVAGAQGDDARRGSGSWIVWCRLRRGRGCRLPFSFSAHRVGLLRRPAAVPWRSCIRDRCDQEEASGRLVRCPLAFLAGTQTWPVLSLLVRVRHSRARTHSLQLGRDSSARFVAPT